MKKIWYTEASGSNTKEAWRSKKGKPEGKNRLHSKSRDREGCMFFDKIENGRYAWKSKIFTVKLGLG